MSSFRKIWMSFTDKNDEIVHSYTILVDYTIFVSKC